MLLFVCLSFVLSWFVHCLVPCLVFCCCCSFTHPFSSFLLFIFSWFACQFCLSSFCRLFVLIYCFLSVFAWFLLSYCLQLPNKKKISLTEERVRLKVLFSARQIRIPIGTITWSTLCPFTVLKLRILVLASHKLSEKSRIVPQVMDGFV